MQSSDEPLVKASYRPVLKVLSLDPYCCQTLRRRMNRCLYHQFIRWSFWILWPQNSSDACRNEGVGSSDDMILILTRPIQAPLSFLSILLLQPSFRELSELDDNQGTWVCIFSWLLVHGQATSAWTPLNSTVKHNKQAIQMYFISLWHLELSKSLAL
jgi:hypothetical protein